MKVILQQDVKGKGKKGQMIEVSDGYARNYMLPRKIAVEATPDNINTMRMNDKALLERQTKERAEAVRIMNEMKEVTLTLRVKGGGAGRAGRQHRSGHREERGSRRQHAGFRRHLQLPGRGHAEGSRNDRRRESAGGKRAG